MSGVVAGFGTEAAMERAFARLQAAGLNAETYTPHPPELVAARSWVPLLMLVCGLGGAALFFFLQCYALIFSYPFDTGGRSLLSWPDFMPLTFEGGVLFAIGAGFFGYLIANRLPHLYDPIDEVEGFREASRDTWFVAVRTGDHDAIRRARELVKPLDPVVLAELPP